MQHRPDIESSYFVIMDMKYPDEMNAKDLPKSGEDQTVEYAKPAYYAVQNLTRIFDNNLISIKNFNYTVTTKKPLSVFAFQDRQTKLNIITIWFDGEIPSDSNTQTQSDFTFTNVRFEQPVYVDLRMGKVFEIPESAYSAKDNDYTFRSIPCYDSPILVADRSNTYLQK